MSYRWAVFGKDRMTYRTLGDGLLAITVKASEEDICRCGKHARTRYGRELDFAGVHGFSGWRGPYCSRECYIADGWEIIEVTA